MKMQLLSLTAVLFVAAGEHPACWSGEKEKVYEVGKGRRCTFSKKHAGFSATLVFIRVDS